MTDTADGTFKATDTHLVTKSAALGVSDLADSDRVVYDDRSITKSLALGVTDKATGNATVYDDRSVTASIALGVTDGSAVDAYIFDNRFITKSLALGVGDDSRANISATYQVTKSVAFGVDEWEKDQYGYPTNSRVSVQVEKVKGETEEQTVAVMVTYSDRAAQGKSS